MFIHMFRLYVLLYKDWGKAAVSGWVSPLWVTHFTIIQRIFLLLLLHHQTLQEKTEGCARAVFWVTVDMAPTLVPQQIRIIILPPGEGHVSVTATVDHVWWTKFQENKKKKCAVLSVSREKKEYCISLVKVFKLC